MLGLLGRAAKDPGQQLLTWMLGGPGACAIRSPSRPIVLGEVGREHCRALVEATRECDYVGVAGLDSAPNWFVERAVELGDTFADPVPQRIHALRDRPAYPGAPGHARQVLAGDGPLFADWLMAFSREAVPDDPVSPRAEIEKVAGEGRHMFWVVDEEPVSMAGIVRRTRSTAAIAAVYTPPAQRGRGLQDRLRRRSPSASSPKARPRPASTPISETPHPTAAMPRSASSPSATPGSIGSSRPR
jgi:hypothetical protein